MCFVVKTHRCAGCEKRRVGIRKVHTFSAAALLQQLATLTTAPRAKRFKLESSQNCARLLVITYKSYNLQVTRKGFVNHEFWCLRSNPAGFDLDESMCLGLWGSGLAGWLRKKRNSPAMIVDLRAGDTVIV